MNDFFLSYAHEDLEMAATLANLLEANGLSVWWDRRLIPGDRFHSVIEEQLNHARAIIVLWSPRSVTSNWVLGEAQTAQDLNKLVPIKVAECNLPIPYRAFHTPEVYRNKSELDQLAGLLSEKYLLPNSRNRYRSAASPISEFSSESSQDFLETFRIGKVFGATCPRCGTPTPAVRMPSSITEALWGGWTCKKCGCRIDRFGNERK